LIETGIGASAGIRVIFNHSVFEILMSVCTLRDLWQELNRSRSQFLKHWSGVGVGKIMKWEQLDSAHL